MKRTAFLAALALALPLAHAATADPVAALAKQSATSRLMIIGELHGTSEVPALVAQLAERVSARKDGAGKAQPVVLALEWQGHETGHQAYLASDGTAADRQRLLASPFWTNAWQDGRASEAMLALLESVRVLARSGRPVQLATFDMEKGQIASDRDAGMAHNLRAIVQANPDARIIALAGNYHARQRPGAPWNPDMRFMANYLADLAPYSVDVDAQRGSHWGCFGATPSDCKSFSFGGDVKGEARLGLYTDSALAKNGYNQGLRLARLTASPPAAARTVKP